MLWILVMIVLIAVVILIAGIAEGTKPPRHQSEEEKQRRARDRKEEALAYFQCRADEHFEIMRGEPDSITGTELEELTQNWESMTAAERRKQLRDWDRMEEEVTTEKWLQYWNFREDQGRKAVRSFGAGLKRKQLKLFRKCPYCGDSMHGKEYCVADHIWPISKGGVTKPENIVFICASCNRKKFDKTLRVFINEQGLDRVEIERVLNLLGKKSEYYGKDFKDHDCWSPEAFDPYHKWLGIPPHEQPPNSYRLLAIRLYESDADVISNAADRAMQYIRTFANGPHSRYSQAILNEISKARVSLLDPQKKRNYDQTLRALMDGKADAPAAFHVERPPMPGPTKLDQPRQSSSRRPVWFQPVAHKVELPKAIADYTEAIRLNPKLGEVQFCGLLHFVEGEYNKAIDDFTEAIRLDSELAEAYYNRGLAYEHKGEYNKAIADYTEAIRLDPELVNAYYNRGLAYEHKGKFNKAIDDFTEAIRLDPKLAMAYSNRGDTHAQKGDFDKAIADCSEAIRLDPEDATAYYIRGWAYQSKGDHSKAEADFAKAKQLR